MLNFDDEARALFKKLNLGKSWNLILILWASLRIINSMTYVEPKKSQNWNALDPIYKHPTSGGAIYVGNQTAAENLQLLQ